LMVMLVVVFQYADLPDSAFTRSIKPEKRCWFDSKSRQ
jgi:hypothetical protein